MAITDETAELSRTGWVRRQTERILASGTTDGVEVLERPVVLLTLRGARSGQLRHTPLMRIEHDGDYAAVASLGGSDHHPSWFWNVQANPCLTLQDGRTRGDFVAREVHGDERDRWWDRAVAAYPEFVSYQQRTTRLFPIFVLEAVADRTPAATTGEPR